MTSRHKARYRPPPSGKPGLHSEEEVYVAMAEEVERARGAYYQLSGCDPATRYPTRARLADLGLDWLAGKTPAPKTT